MRARSGPRTTGTVLSCDAARRRRARVQALVGEARAHTRLAFCAAATELHLTPDVEALDAVPATKAASGPAVPTEVGKDAKSAPVQTCPPKQVVNICRAAGKYENLFLVHGQLYRGSELLDRRPLDELSHWLVKPRPDGFRSVLIVDARGDLQIRDLRFMKLLHKARYPRHKDAPTGDKGHWRWYAAKDTAHLPKPGEPVNSGTTNYRIQTDTCLMDTCLMDTCMSLMDELPPDRALSPDRALPPDTPKTLPRRRTTVHLPKNTCLDGIFSSPDTFHVIDCLTWDGHHRVQQPFQVRDMFLQAE